MVFRFHIGSRRRRHGENQAGQSTPTIATILSLVLLGPMGINACSGQVDSDRATTPPTPLSAIEMEQAVRSALAEHQVLARSALLIPLLQGIDAGNVQGAAQVFEEQLSIGNKQDLRLFLAAWGKFDPKDTLDYASKWKMTNMRSFGVATVASDWAARGGGREAAEALLELREWRARDNALGEMMFGWVGSGDVDDATEFVAGLPESDGRKILTENIATGLMQEQGAENMIAWSNELIHERDESFWRPALDKALQLVSKRAPVRAAQWWTKYEDQEWAKHGFRTVAFDWAASDPVAALAWIRELPGEGTRHVALIKIATQWAASDLSGMAEWLESATLPDSERQYLLEPFVRRAALSDPEMASKWIDRLENQQEITTTTVMTVRSWRKKDHRAAVAWLDSRDVPEEVRLYALGLKPGLPFAPTPSATGEAREETTSEP